MHLNVCCCSASTILITTVGTNCTQRVVRPTEHTSCNFTFFLTFFTLVLLLTSTRAVYFWLFTQVKQVKEAKESKVILLALQREFTFRVKHHLDVEELV